MLSNIAISGAQVNFGIAVWKFIPRISLGLVRAWKRKDRQSIVTRKGWWEPLLSDEREKQHLFFSILLYLSHINMPVGPIYAYMYIIYYTHINLYVVCVYLYIYIHTYISAYVIFPLGAKSLTAPSPIRATTRKTAIITISRFFMSILPFSKKNSVKYILS